MEPKPSTQQLVQTVALTKQICALPAVATADWADRAARALASVASDSVAVVLLGRVSPTGSVMSVEATGASAASSVQDGEHAALAARSAMERTADLGCPIDLTNPPMVASGAALLGHEWRSTPIARVWARVPDRLLLGATPLGTEADRTMAVLVGSWGESAANPIDAAVVRACLPELARRAELAIGERTSTASRWLTTREQAVLEQLTLGRSVREIAENIGRSPHTIHDHVKSLHRKLNASSRGELVARALGYIDDDHRVLGALADSMVEPKPAGRPAAQPGQGPVSPDGAQPAGGAIAEPKPVRAKAMPIRKPQG